MPDTSDGAASQLTIDEQFSRLWRDYQLKPPPMSQLIDGLFRAVHDFERLHWDDASWRRCSPVEVLISLLPGMRAALRHLSDQGLRGRVASLMAMVRSAWRTYMRAMSDVSRQLQRIAQIEGKPAPRGWRRYRVPNGYVVDVFLRGESTAAKTTPEGRVAALEAAINAAPTEWRKLSLPEWSAFNFSGLLQQMEAQEGVDGERLFRDLAKAEELAAAEMVSVGVGSLTSPPGGTEPVQPPSSQTDNARAALVERIVDSVLQAHTDNAVAKALAEADGRPNDQTATSFSKKELRGFFGLVNRRDFDALLGSRPRLLIPGKNRDGSANRQRWHVNLTELNESELNRWPKWMDSREQPEREINSAQLGSTGPNWSQLGSTRTVSH